MLSKSQIRFVTSLQQKKFRKQHGAFVVEGLKSIQEFLHADNPTQPVQQLFLVTEVLAKMDKIPDNIKLFEVSESDLNKISSLCTPQGALAVVGYEDRTFPDHSDEEAYLTRLCAEVHGQFTLALEEVQDPGNLGTIIRIADWFGFERIVCSKGCVDAYNPKTVQASMGSLARVRVDYVDLPNFLKGLSTDLPIFGAMLNGISIYETEFGQTGGIVVLGNEGKGISEEVAQFLTQPVTIPRVGHAESLNVAISAALFCSELRRAK